MAKLYLDSSAIVKRYVVEQGSDLVNRVYTESDAQAATICFSLWNVGETIGVIESYQRRGWLSEEGGSKAIKNFAGETLRLKRIEGLELLPVSSAAISDAWSLVKKHHIYQADALQIVSCSKAGARSILSADRQLLEAAGKEGLEPVNIEDPQGADERMFEE